jgi:hypothetical protein
MIMDAISLEYFCALSGALLLPLVFSHTHSIVMAAPLSHQLYTHKTHARSLVSLSLLLMHAHRSVFPRDDGRQNMCIKSW